MERRKMTGVMKPARPNHRFSPTSSRAGGEAIFFACQFFLRIVLIVPAALLPAGFSAAENPKPEPVMVADRLYYDGEEDNLGLDIGAQFTSLASLTAYVSPDREVGTFQGRIWKLFDILVDADFNANGYTADWRISGPQPLLLEYKKSLEQDRDRHVFVDLSVQTIDFKPTAYWETEGDPIEVTLTSDRKIYQIGEPILLQATIRNNTKKDMVFVRPQGGSDRAWQYPLGVFELKDAQGQEIETYVARCKTMDPLQPVAFFLLAPGGSAQLYPEGHHLEWTYVVDRPGAYDITYQYSTVAGKEWQWYGAYSDEYWKERLDNEFWRKQETTVQINRLLLDRVERFSSRTNTIRIEIVARLISREEALQIARTECEKEGWPWQDPIIAEKDGLWEVTTKRATLGGNAFIRIDKQTGTVMEKHLTGP